MKPVNIIILILGVLTFFLIIYLVISLYSTKKTELITLPDISGTPVGAIVPIVEPKICDRTAVLDYDEINLNELKKNSLDTKIDLETQQKTFDPRTKLAEIPRVRTYMDLPGYKAYNLELLNSLELKDNNHGLINYNELKENERFKAKNSLLYS
jgi:hypothetical protein